MLSNWKSVWYPAPGPLAGVLAGIWSVHSARDEELSARVLPDGSTSLVFQREGSMLRSADDGWRPWASACVSGPRTGPFDFKLGAAGRIFIVQLLPAGAAYALGAPMSTMVDRFEQLDLVTGPESQRVSDFVLGDDDDTMCVRAIEQWLSRRVRTRVASCSATDAAIMEVTRRAGNIRVDDLAGHVNLSRRHLGRVIKERVGASPKLFARITRFNHAVQLSRMHPTLPWARIALDSGYADQAHLTREFAELGRIRPSDLRGATAATIW